MSARLCLNLLYLNYFLRMFKIHVLSSGQYKKSINKKQAPVDHILKVFYWYTVGKTLLPTF